MKTLSLVFARCERRGGWLYTICLVVVILYGLLYTSERSFHANVPYLTAFAPMLLPIGIILLQVLRPTLLGWAAVLTGFTFYTVIGCYFLIRNFGWSQWRVDTSGFVLGSMPIAALMAICIGLWRQRPVTANRRAA